jgi:hypothetical protein
MTISSGRTPVSYLLASRSGHVRDECWLVAARATTAYFFTTAASRRPLHDSIRFSPVPRCSPCGNGVGMGAIRASPAGQRIAFACVRTCSTRPARCQCLLQRCDASGRTRPARPILGLNLGHVCVGPDSAPSSRVYPRPPWALPSATLEIVGQSH